MRQQVFLAPHGLERTMQIAVFGVPHRRIPERNLTCDLACFSPPQILKTDAHQAVTEGSKVGRATGGVAGW